LPGERQRSALTFYRFHLKTKHRRTILRYVYSFVSALLFAGMGLAQMQTVQGELSSDVTHEWSQFTVELQPAAGGATTTDKVYVASDGRFQFRNLAPGSYLVVVRDRLGTAVHQQYSSTQGFGGFSMRLPAPEAKHRPVSGLVSVDELRHEPPRAARKAFEQSAKRSQNGDTAGAIAALERAVEIDPIYLQALNNLGSQYVRAGRYAEAADRFRRAIALAPKVPMLHANLAQALLGLRDYPAAEASAREAIALNASDPMTPRAQLALGLALAGRGEIADARHVMVTCTHSADEAVRTTAERFLALLR
jgi:tetratricopeptide (TPR) repeat protein